jgi:hypothetical protein
MFSIQIQLAPNGRISSVYFGGRPKKLFGGEGDHTTAWHLITEGVGNLLRGHTQPEAFQIIMGLGDILVELPGTKVSQQLQGSLKERFASANKEYLDLRGLATKVLQVAQQERDERATIKVAIIKNAQPSQSVRLSILQEFIRAYLEQRYVIPLSIVSLNLAHGKGEASRLKRLREYSDALAAKANLTPDQLGDLRINMWGLLDIQAVAALSIANLNYVHSKQASLQALQRLTNIPAIGHLSAFPTLEQLVNLSKQAPNPVTTRQTELNKLRQMALMESALTVDEISGVYHDPAALMYIETDYRTVPERLAALLAQHLLTLATLWPQIYENSGIATIPAVTAFLQKHGCHVNLIEATLNYLKGIKNFFSITAVNIQKTEQQYSLAEIVISDADEAGNTVVRPGAMAVQLVLSPEELIAVVRQGGRPEPTFGSALGDHTTAWSVIQGGIQQAVQWVSIREAIVRVRNFYNDALQLPGNQFVSNLAPQHKDRYQAAQQELLELAKLFNNPGGAESLSLLENYIRAYLRFRHVIPLTAINNGPANGKGEFAHIQPIKEAEAGKFGSNFTPEAKSELRLNIWGLLDMEALTILATDNVGNSDWIAATKTVKSKGEPSTLERQPYSTLGANILSYRETLAFGLQQHLMTLRSCFPNIYASSQIGSVQAVSALLKKHALEDNGILDLLNRTKMLVDDPTIKLNLAEFTPPVKKGKSTKAIQEQDDAEFKDNGDDDYNDSEDYEIDEDEDE